MPSNAPDFDFLEDLANRIREPNQKLLEEFKKNEKHRTLSNKLATKADKLIIRDSKANRKAMQKKPGGFTGRIARRAGGAALGGIGGAIGGIPIAGAIFRAIGQEAAATLKDKKNYQRELARQRKVEHKLMEQYELARKKKEQEEIDAANPKPKTRGTGGTGGGTSNAAVVKLSEAAAKLEAAAISLTPAIQTFDEIAVKIHDVVERLADHNGSPSKVTDSQTLEYLHAIEFFTQETAATVEKIGANMARGRTVGGRNVDVIGPKAMEYLHGIEFFSQEMAAKIETMEAQLGGMTKDVDLLRIYAWKTYGSSTRIETLLKQAAKDRLVEIDLEQKQYKLQKKQFDTQEESKFISVLGVVASLLGGLGGLVGAAGEIGAIVIGGAAAFLIGKEIGEQLYKWLDGNPIFESIMNKMFEMVDDVLAAMGNEDAKARVKNREDMKWINYAQDLAKQSGIPQLDPATEQYVKENHTLPGMDADTFANRGITGGLFNTSIGAKSPEEMAKLMQNWQMDQAKPALPGQDLIPASAGLEEAKAEAQAKRALRQQTIQQNTQNTTNSQTVVPQTLSADPAGGVVKSRNLGD
jgi:hypothetical protein